MAARRYIVKSGRLTFRTPGGSFEQELWLGVEIDGLVNLPFLSRCGYDLIPADGLTPDELRSIGVSSFERIDLPVDADYES